MGMLLGGGGVDNSFVVVLPIRKIVAFADAHAHVCGPMAQHVEL